MLRKFLIILFIAICVLAIATAGCTSFFEKLNPLNWGDDNNNNPAPSKGRPTIQPFNPSKKAQ
jgi:hypothetical protein